jgi:hypothetical protein
VRHARWWPLVAVLASALLMAFGTVVYVDYVNRRNDARWCALLVPLDEAYQATPPATQTGRDVAAAIRRLRQQHRC